MTARDEAEDALLPKSPVENSNPDSSFFAKNWSKIAATIMMLIFALATILWPRYASASECVTAARGYQCQPDISHNWGQYSPYFTVPSSIPNIVPQQCEITFAQVLSRHGARFPTTSKTAQYNNTIQQLHKNVTSYRGKYAFLADYTYTLGANDLTVFGQDEMIKSGQKFYDHYETLSRKQTPFFRASSEARVVESAMNFTQGFHTAKIQDRSADEVTDSYPYPLVVIQEGDGFNNTLNHDLCTNFESGPNSNIGNNAQATWANIFVPPIQRRLNHDLAGANVSITQVIYLMDLCPFNTVANTDGKLSSFCDLFSQNEWQQYSYYETLGKWYGYGPSNPLGPTQGVGFTNELIARMTGKPVQDHTSVNHTLDDGPATFPIGPSHNLFADFSHDNDITGHFAAMGLYNMTRPLSNTTLEDPYETHGYSAAWTVPFAARAYFEKMRCRDSDEELVRILVNDRVIPLQSCGADQLGRCKLGTWVESLSFARVGGYWDQCFT